MLPKRKRLSRSQFDTVFSGGRRRSSVHISIIVSERESGYAVVVPKKVARLSVTRHLIKRRVAAALSAAMPPFSVIVFPKSSVRTMSVLELTAELRGLLSKI